MYHVSRSTQTHRSKRKSCQEIWNIYLKIFELFLYFFYILIQNVWYINFLIYVSKPKKKFPWIKFITEGIYHPNQYFEINANETILVEDWDYLEEAVKIYKEYNTTRQRDFDNFCIWKLVKGKIGLLSKKFKNAKQEYEMVIIK